MSSMTKIATVLMVGAVAVACATAKDPAAPAATAPACPLGVTGTTVTTEDVPGGIMLTFTKDGDPAELRERVFDASAAYGTGAGYGKGHEGKHGEGGRHGLQLMQLPPVSAASAEVEGGARIRFVAADPNDTEALRAKLRARAAELTTTPCRG